MPMQEIYEREIHERNGMFRRFVAVVLYVCGGACFGLLLSAKGCVNPAYAHETWRGLVVAPEARCAPYDPADYDYPASIERRIWLTLGAAYSPYDDVVYPSLRSTDIEHLVPRSEAMTAVSVQRLKKSGTPSRTIC